MIATRSNSYDIQSYSLTETRPRFLAEKRQQGCTQSKAFGLRKSAPDVRRRLAVAHFRFPSFSAPNNHSTANFAMPLSSWAMPGA